MANAMKWLSLTLVATACACVDLPGLRDRGYGYECDGGDASSCEPMQPNAGGGGARGGAGGARAGAGASGSGASGSEAGGDGGGADAAVMADGGVGMDASPGSDGGSDDGGMDAALQDASSEDGSVTTPDSGLDCQAIEDECVSDAVYERTVSPATNECGFTCIQTPRVCSLVADSQCPAACTYRDDADCARPNRVFLTKTGYDGNLGGLAGADAKCQASANAAGLQGTFKALIGTSTTSLEVRLGTARGFVRLDGEPLADQASALLQGSVFTAPILNEYMERMPAETMVATGFVRGPGDASFICEDWTTNLGVGDYGIAGDGGGVWRYLGLGGCDNRLHLYCTETSEQVVVRPRAEPTARKAFVAFGFDPSTGLAGADETCMDAATAADLHGTFKAFLATPTQPAIARFDLTGAPWARVDGTPIVESAVDLAGGRLLAPINQTADGNYQGDGRVFTGTSDARRTALDSCKSWSVKAGPVTGHAGRITSTGSSFLSDPNLSSLSCANERAYVYCLEEEGQGSAPAAPSGGTANTVFVTEDTWNGALGGIAGADAKCRAAASGAGLSGTFIALVSSATASVEERLAGARGFVRKDGEPIADTPLDLVRGMLLYPPNISEDGNVINGIVWTGWMAGCREFTSGAGDAQGTYGTAGSDGSGAFYAGHVGCNAPAHLYCAQTAHQAAITPPSRAGKRLAFLARGGLLVFEKMFYAVDPSGGLAGLDAQCMAEAQAFGLPGTYGAFVSTSSASAVSRFNAGGTPWARVDGPLIAPTAAVFLNLGPETSSISVTADGFEHFGASAVWLGTDDALTAGNQNCSNWSSNQSSASAWTARTGTLGAITAYETSPCNSTFLHVFCLQF